MKQNERITGKEQYYTPTNTAQFCFDVINPFIPKYMDLVWLEPAGGTGGFIDVIIENGHHNIISYDIEPKHPSVIKTNNFL
jgi:hypothetical protein